MPLLSNMDIKPGLYRHFKGHVYKVMGVAKHSETLEELVVYGKGKDLWVRPKKMFGGKVTVNGKKVPRFKYIKSEL